METIIFYINILLKDTIFFILLIIFNKNTMYNKYLFTLLKYL